MRLFLGYGAFIVLLISSAGCSSSPPPEAPRGTFACSGTGCDCEDGSWLWCACGAADGGSSQCSFSCVGGPCEVAFVCGSTCDASTTEAITLFCGDSAQCTATLGGGSQFLCQGHSICTGTVGANSFVQCAEDASCTVEVGAGAKVDCDRGPCEVTCDADCTVTRGQYSASSPNIVVTCAADGGSVAATTCPDGRVVCGAAC